jgi:hypothetical protein
MKTERCADHRNGELLARDALQIKVIQSYAREGATHTQSPAARQPISTDNVNA